LGEHALHSWDIAVAFDSKAVVAPDAVALLIDTIDEMVARIAKPSDDPLNVQITTTDPHRNFLLDVSETVTFTPTESSGTRARITLPAESFIRLVYGRLDPDHTPPVTADGVDLDQLRRVFVGV
jgi:hypothetical protein